MSKRPKIKCEVCGESDSRILEYHHIIPRTDLNCSHDNMNLAVLCSNCHSKIHLGNLKVFGVLPSTDPSGFTLIYELDGVKNIDVDVPNFVKKPKEMKVFYGREDGKTPGDE